MNFRPYSTGKTVELSLSHDLKTPLASITGASSSLLKSPALDEETRHLMETVADEASRLNRLLENILQVSMLDAGAELPTNRAMVTGYHHILVIERRLQQVVHVSSSESGKITHQSFSRTTTGNQGESG